jgi:hypothetical protein
MQFSYAVRGNRLIDSANIDLLPGTACLVTGVENPSLALLGGIIAGLFPVHEEIDVPQLQALIEIYTGELAITEGGLPASTSYVGSDPERRLLFSKVKEEILAQMPPTSARHLDLRSFGPFGTGPGFPWVSKKGLHVGEEKPVAQCIMWGDWEPKRGSRLKRRICGVREPSWRLWRNRRAVVLAPFLPGCLASRLPGSPSG